MRRSYADSKTRSNPTGDGRGLFFWQSVCSMLQRPGFIYPEPVRVSMEIPTELLPDGFTQDRFGHPICPCGNKTEVDGGFPCDHENPLNELI